MIGLLETLSVFIIHFIDKIGYFGVGVLMVVESAGIPVPSEVTMPFSGYLASIGRFNFWSVILIGAIANLIGSWFFYELGKRKGYRFVEKYGKFFLIHQDDVANAKLWFKRYGNLAVFISRLLPGARTYISLLGGVFNVNLKSFIALTFFGSFIWSWFLTFLGFYLGERWQQVRIYFVKFDKLILILIILAIMWWIRRHFHKRDI